MTKLTLVTTFKNIYIACLLHCKSSEQIVNYSTRIVVNLFNPTTDVATKQLEGLFVSPLCIKTNDITN